MTKTEVMDRQETYDILTAINQTIVGVAELSAEVFTADLDKIFPVDNEGCLELADFWVKNDRRFYRYQIDFDNGDKRWVTNPRMQKLYTNFPGVQRSPEPCDDPSEDSFDEEEECEFCWGYWVQYADSPWPERESGEIRLNIAHKYRPTPNNIEVLRNAVVMFGRDNVWINTNFETKRNPTDTDLGLEDLTCIVSS